MRRLLLVAVVAAGCAHARTPVADAENAAGRAGAAPYDGPPVVEVTERTTTVKGSEALGPPIHAAMVQGFDADGSYATEGAPPRYHIEAQLAALTVTHGTPSRVECRVQLTLMKAPDRALFGFVDGKATVSAAAGEEQIAAEDCVTAVVQNLLSTKVIPAMHDKDADL